MRFARIRTTAARASIGTRAFGFEARLPRDVACDEDASDGPALLVDERRRRQKKGSAQLAVLDLPRAAARAARQRRIRRGEPRRRLRSDQFLGARVEQIAAPDADAHGERLVRLDDASFAIEHDDEVDERIERVFEQAPLAQDFVEQLDVLDRDAELPRRFVGRFDGSLVAAPFDHERPQ